MIRHKLKAHLHELKQLNRALLHEWLTSRSRVLVCFDFAYGYPVDFAAALESATGKSDLPWRLVWQYLNEAVKDDMGTLPNRRPSNRSNRFEVANLINSALSSSREAAGPFWCSATEAAYLHIPQRRPDQPFASAQGYLIKPLRLTDKRAKSGTPFRLFGTASVGGQSITGIPHLYKLRNEPELAPRSAVWPFETGWAIKASWLPEHISIVHAEIYPTPPPSTLLFVLLFLPPILYLARFTATCVHAPRFLCVAFSRCSGRRPDRARASPLGSRRVLSVARADLPCDGALRSTSPPRSLCVSHHHSSRPPPPRRVRGAPPVVRAVAVPPGWCFHAPPSPTDGGPACVRCCAVPLGGRHLRAALRYFRPDVSRPTGRSAYVELLVSCSTHTRRRYCRVFSGSRAIERRYICVTSDSPTSSHRVLTLLSRVYLSRALPSYTLLLPQLVLMSTISPIPQR